MDRGGDVVRDMAAAARAVDTMVAVAPTLVARSQLSLSRRLIAALVASGHFARIGGRAIGSRAVAEYFRC